MVKVASWLWGSTVRELGIERVTNIAKRLGIRHLLLLVKGVSGKVVLDVLESMTTAMRGTGVSVHAWIVCFVDRSWGNVSPEDEAYRRYLLDLIRKILSVEGVAGIHLDYVRYGGHAWHRWPYVSSFVKEVRKIVDSVDPSLVLSAATKAEAYTSRDDLAKNALYYGQRYQDLASYIDVFFPMTYHLDYGVTPSQAVLAALWVKELTNRATYVGVQLHPSENPDTLGRAPRAEEISSYARWVRELGLDGLCFFRFGLAIERLGDLMRALGV